MRQRKNLDPLTAERPLPARSLHLYANRPAVPPCARPRFARFSAIGLIALGAALLWHDVSNTSMANPIPPPAQATDGKSVGSLVEAPPWTDGKPSFVLDDLTGARHD